MSVEARRWLEFAQEELETAGLLEREGRWRGACFWSQQAAEKSLKGLLVAAEIEPPRSHNLNELRNLLPSGHPVAAAFPDLAELTQWAVEARYPGDWPEQTGDDAKAALAQAREIVSAAAAHLEAGE